MTHVNGSGTCPKCGRTGTPRKKHGGFKAHFPKTIGGRVCYGPSAEEIQQDRIRGQRLLAHIDAGQTRWGKVSTALLEFARKGVPEHRDSYNPVRRLAGDIGVWMDDRQTRKINERYPL